MKDATDPSLFDCTHKRHGERLVQGILRFALSHDPEFRQLFCRWAGLDSACSQIQEEVDDAVGRHDLVLVVPDARNWNVELKLDAGFTHAQRTDAGRIDLLILPEYRLVDIEGWFPENRVRTWESLLADVVPRSKLASLLLADFDRYVWGRRTYSRSEVVSELQDSTVLGGDLVDVSIVLQLSHRAHEIFGLQSSRSAAIKRRGAHVRFPYVGRYIKNSGFTVGDPAKLWKLWLWFGFVIELGDEGSVVNIELMTQIPTVALARKLGVETKLDVPWYRWQAEPVGVLAKPAEDGTYDLDEIWSANAELLGRYSKLT